MLLLNRKRAERFNDMAKVYQMQEQQEQQEPQKRQYNWFAFILYPEDERHACILEYIKQNTMLYDKWVAVLHDRDLPEDDVQVILAEGLTTGKEFKKPHYHVLVRTQQKMTANGFLKRWVVRGVPCLSHVELVNDYIAYIQYMAHIDFASLSNGCKSLYRTDEFIGTADLISKALDKTNILSNWELLADMYESIKEMGFSAFAVQCANDSPVNAQRYWELFQRFQGVFLNANHSYEYINSLKGE